MKNPHETFCWRLSSIGLMPSLKLALVLVGFVFLAACASEPTPESPESPAQVKADAKARDAFARDLPKPRER